MNVSLIGYGQMGKMLETLSKDFDINIVHKIDPTKDDCDKELTAEILNETDVFIDFSLPSIVMKNIETVISNGKKIVVGTTGWYDHINEVKNLVSENNGSFIFGTNFSVGMNTFFKIVEEASKKFNKFSEYDPFGYELHHNKKVDSPSGTAKTICNIMLENLDRKTETKFDSSFDKIKENELHFSSTRAGRIPGTHVVGFDSEADTIELKHTARNRVGFALGALRAAVWLNDKKGFYEFYDVFEEM